MAFDEWLLLLELLFQLFFTPFPVWYLSFWLVVLSYELNAMHQLYS